LTRKNAYISSQKKEKETEFLLEEYRNIAGTHDKLRELQQKIFNYSLLMSAFPFTVIGIIYRDKPFNFFTPPAIISILFFIIGAGIFLLSLTLVSARLSQYRYAKTVNLIRSYFTDSNSELKKYLFLPTTVDVPKWTELGYIKGQVIFMVFMGWMFTLYSVVGMHNEMTKVIFFKGWQIIAVAFSCIYPILFTFLYLKSIQKFTNN
jgi:hypothetical protein